MEYSDEIFETMPKRYKGIIRQIFRDIREQVIFLLWMQYNQLLKDGLGSFGVEINIVEEELVDVLDEKGMYTGKIETRANCSKEG